MDRTTGPKPRLTRRKGGRAAFGALYDRYVEAVYVRVLPRKEDADAEDS